jgi:hypothetical protein
MKYLNISSKKEIFLERKFFFLKKTVYLSLFSMILFFINGCAPALRVSKVNKDSTKALEGLYYSLPKTVIDIEIPIIKTIKSPGKYVDFAECLFDGNIIKEEKTSFNTGDVNITTRHIPDEEQIYNIQIGGWWFFQTRDAVIKLTEDGLLTGVVDSVEDKTIEFTVKTLATGIGVAAKYALASYTGGLQAARASQPFTTTSTLETIFFEIIKNNSIECILKFYNDNRKENVFDKDNLSFKNEKARKAASTYMKLLGVQKNISEILNNKPAMLTNAYQTKEALEFSIKELKTIEENLKSEFVGFTSNQKFNLKLSISPQSDKIYNIMHFYKEDQKKFFIEIPSYVDQRNISPDWIQIVTKDRSSFDSNFELNIEEIESIGRFLNKHNISRKGSFRYRLPAQAKITILESRIEKGATAKTKIAMQDINLAQWGAIVTLPRRTGTFISNKYDFTVFEKTGGLSNFILGTKSLDPNILDPVGQATKEYIDARDPLVLLKRQKEFLETQKSIIETQQSISELLNPLPSSDEDNNADEDDSENGDN